MSFVSFQSLRVFVKVTEHGSLSAAGRELSMTQPAVSNHIHSLEARYGVPLFSRGRPLVTTPAGKTLAVHARRVIAAVGELDGEMVSQARPRGELTVGSSTTPAEVYVPQIAARFGIEYPEVSLKVKVFQTGEAITELLGRGVEIAIVGRVPQDSRLESEVVQEDELVPIRSSNAGNGKAEMEVAELSGVPFVMREEGSATRYAVEKAFGEVGFAPGAAVEMGSNAAVIGAVAAGIGVGVVPSRTVEGNTGVETFSVEGISFRRPFTVVTEKGRQLSPAASAFVQTCRAMDI